jgi:drug/metabolite transporter (DMT)-like permease
MTLGYILALGSAVFYGAGDFTGGLTSRRASIISVVLLSQAAGLVLLALMLPLLPDASPTRLDLLWGAAAGLTGGVGIALLYRALAIGTMSVVSPVTAVCAVAIPVVYALLRGERPLPIALWGIGLGVVSIVLVSKQQAAAPDIGEPGTGRSRHSGVGTALASGVAIGLFFITFAQSGSSAGMWPLLAARLVSVSMYTGVALVARRSLRMPAPVLRLVILAGILDMAANALYVLATRNGPLSIVVTLSSLYPASTVLLARIVLKERLSGWQVMGVASALAAVVLIVFGSN